MQSGPPAKEKLREGALDHSADRGLGAGPAGADRSPAACSSTIFDRASTRASFCPRAARTRAAGIDERAQRRQRQSAGYDTCARSALEEISELAAARRDRPGAGQGL